MHVQAERVVAPCDIAQVLRHPPVVLGVDDRLLPVVGPGVGARRAERESVGLGEREQAPAALTLAGERVVQVLPAPEMISISEEISSPAMASNRTGSPSAAARRNSKRGSMSRVPGSRIANSSSTPTVKSVACANVAAT